VAEVLAAFRHEAEALGVPLVVVVVPDRILADGELRERLGLPADLEKYYDLGALRRFVAERAGAPVVDVTDALRGGSVDYRESDTHLSDVGNVAAGRFVGERLAGFLAGRPAAAYSTPDSQATIARGVPTGAYTPDSQARRSTRIGMK
jgi:hypothetical protein